MKINTRNLMIFPSVLAITLMMSACGAAVSASEPSQSPVSTGAAISAIEAFGVVESTRVLNVGIPIQADILELNVRDGQRVNQNEVLAVLDISESAYRIAQKKEEISSFTQDIAYTETQGTGKQADIARLQNDLGNARRLLAEDEKEMARKAGLLKQGIIVQKEIDDQQEKVASQKKTVRDAELALSGAKDSTGLSNTEKANLVAQKRSQLKRLEAELANMEKSMETSSLQAGTVHSPMIDAVVTEVQVRAGDRTTPGQKLFTLKDMDALVVNADIAEEFIKDVKPGMAVEIVPVSDKSKTYAGKISRVSVIAVSRNGQMIIPAEITFDQPDDFIFPGFNVNVSIPMRQAGME